MVRSLKRGSRAAQLDEQQRSQGGLANLYSAEHGQHVLESALAATPRDLERNPQSGIQLVSVRSTTRQLEAELIDQLCDAFHDVDQLWLASTRPDPQRREMIVELIFVQVHAPRVFLSMLRHNR